jgi:hypothetical protein
MRITIKGFPMIKTRHLTLMNTSAIIIVLSFFTLLILIPTIESNHITFYDPIPSLYHNISKIIEYNNSDSYNQYQDSHLSNTEQAKNTSIMIKNMMFTTNKVHFSQKDSPSYPMPKGSPGPIIAIFLEQWAKNTNQYYEQPQYELDAKIAIKRVSDTKDNFSISIVDDEGDTDFISIQDAINHSNIGDVVLVYSGTYHEQIIIDKPIWLIGISSEYLSGSDNGQPCLILPESIQNLPTIHIRSNNVTCMGFTIQSTSLGIDISVDSSETTLFENTIICGPNASGIRLLSSYGTILFNNINSEDHYGKAITVINATHTTINNNTINGCNTALHLINTTYTIVQKNMFTSCDCALDISESLNHSTFMLNNFIGNDEDICVSDQTLLDSNSWGNEGIGNYWDTYEGYDENDDGIGDVPYQIIPGIIDINPLYRSFNNHAPDPPRINPDEQGVLCGKTEESIPFFIQISDPDINDTLSGTWVKDTTDTWIGPYGSSETIYIANIWNSTADTLVSVYHLSFICKDSYGTTTASHPYDIHIYDLKALNNPILRRLLDIMIPSYFLSGWQ